MGFENVPLLRGDWVPAEGWVDGIRRRFASDRWRGAEFRDGCVGCGREERPLASSPGGGRHRGPQSRERTVARYPDGPTLHSAKPRGDPEPGLRLTRQQHCTFRPPPAGGAGPHGEREELARGRRSRACRAVSCVGGTCRGREPFRRLGSSPPRPCGPRSPARPGELPEVGVPIGFSSPVWAITTAPQCQSAGSTLAFRVPKSTLLGPVPRRMAGMEAPSESQRLRVPGIGDGSVAAGQRSLSRARRLKEQDDESSRLLVRPASISVIGSITFT